MLAFLPGFVWSQYDLTHYGTNSGVNGNGSSYFGVSAGYSAVSMSANYNTLIGYYSGRNITTGINNSFVGASSGQSLTTGSNNSFLGYQAGYSSTSGSHNTYIGYQTGYTSTLSGYNTYIGYQAGYSSAASYNTYIGTYCGYNNSSGTYNTMIGYSAGRNNTSGARNVFVGYGAGYNETGSNKLYISNSSTTTPLIYGDFSTNALTINGSFKVGTSNLYVNTTNNTVGIGTTDTKGYTLGVNGKIIATEVVVKEYVNWPDYVFENNYKLAELTEVEAYVKEKKHLPGVPSANEVKDNGVALGEMNKILLLKIEELTLHMIQQQKEIDALKQQINNK